MSATKEKKVKKSTLVELAQYDEADLRAALEAKQRPANELRCAAKVADKIVTSLGLPDQTWHVTTEGDVEGRSTTELGTYTGHVVDIAMALMSQACYSLTFKRILPIDVTAESKKNVGEVSVVVDGAGSSSSVVSCWLGRSRTKRRGGYTVGKSNYFAAVTIKTHHKG
jgi:hypothetical protein